MSCCPLFQWQHQAHVSVLLTVSCCSICHLLFTFAVPHLPNSSRLLGNDLPVQPQSMGQATWQHAG